ncbi:MAG TPA: ABC transporter ATP-binding protein [Verrucomicrobiales bacterium]|nr:ABC transporter ATP-binding protein [Verrucomicrobiales bacterium]
MPTLELESVTKTYPNGVLALDRLAMTVDRRTIFGLLGPNGAGKSTLLKVLMTLVRPDESRGTLLGEALGSSKALRRTGYLPENPTWPKHLSAEGILDLAARLYEVGSRERRRRVEEMLELTGLLAWRRDRPSVYSKGMRQRLGLGYALMGDPDIIFLDEPTDGVDPIGRKEMRDIIRRLKEKGKTVFINSHVLGELETICDSVAILSRGRVVRQGSMEELTAESMRYEMCIQGNVLHDTVLVELVEQLGGTLCLSGAETEVNIPTRRPHLIQPVIDAVRERGYLIISVAPARQSLEELFLEAMQMGSADTPGGRSR